MAKRWNYSGDINLEHGGLFWREPEEGFTDYVEAVEVIPVSDMGGPDNEWLILRGSIYMPREKYGWALETCGYKLAASGKSLLAYASDPIPVASKQGLAVLVNAFRAYYGIDEPSKYGVRIGKTEPQNNWRGGYDAMGIDYELRGNSSLLRFVRREFLELER